MPANSREGAREADFAVRRRKVPPIASTRIASAAFSGEPCERNGRHKSGSRQGRLAEFEAGSPRDEPIASAIGAESPIAVSRSPISTSSTSERATPSLPANSFPPPATRARHGSRLPPGSLPGRLRRRTGSASRSPIGATPRGPRIRGRFTSLEVACQASGLQARRGDASAMSYLYRRFERFSSLALVCSGQDGSRSRECRWDVFSRNDSRGLARPPGPDLGLSRNIGFRRTRAAQHCVRPLSRGAGWAPARSGPPRTTRAAHAATASPVRALGRRCASSAPTPTCAAVAVGGLGRHALPGGLAALRPAD